MEQALIFASIIVGVAVSDQILSLNRLLRADAPVRWHWALPLTALLILLANVQIWWSLAGDRAQKVSIGEFLPSLVQLIMVALLSAASLPDKVPTEGIDLKQYYDRHARYIWILFTLTVIWAVLVALVAALNHDQSLIDLLWNSTTDLIVILVMIALAFVRRWWWVALGLGFLFLGPINWLSRTLN